MQRTLVPRIRAGMVFINQYVTPKINAPFGGELISGVGRSLGFEGLKEFANIKTVFVGNNSRD